MFILHEYCTVRNRDSSVGIATRLTVGRPGFDFRQGKRFSLLQSPDRLSGPGNVLYNGNGGTYTGDVKRQVHEDDHSLPSSSEVKNGGATPPLPKCFHSVVLNYISN
jgi:hypothetical protein